MVLVTGRNKIGYCEAKGESMALVAVWHDWEEGAGALKVRHGASSVTS
jgi:hypothetical protein